MSKKVKEKNISQPTQQDEVALLKAQLTRALADYDNLNKRVARDTIEIGDRIRSQFLMELLPAIDMIFAVQKHLNDPGLALAISQFEQSIADQQIVKIEPQVGDDFDENLHEAVDTVESTEKQGKIAELLQLGWRFHEGKAITHAKVKVFK